MAQPPGLGLSPVPSSPTPQGSTLGAIGGALQGRPVGGAPKFSDNPLAAIGLVLSNVSAGFQGRELPTTQIARQQLQQRQLDLQMLRVNLDAVKQGVEMFSGLDPEDPETQEQIDRFTAQFTPLIGEGFKTSLTAGLELDRTRGRQALDGLVEHQERIQGICGADRDCIQRTAGNAALMEQFNQTADLQSTPGIMQKFQAINAAVGDNELLAQLADQGYTLAELQQLPEGFKFTDAEIRTISRNEQIQNLLMSSGFEPPNLTAEMARATRLAEIQISTALTLRQPPNLVFNEETVGDEVFRVGVNPQTGDVVSRRPVGNVDPGELSFQTVKENGVEYIVGLDKVTGEERSRKVAGSVSGPTLQFREVTEANGQKFYIGLDPESGEEVSRVAAGALIPSDPPSLTFKEVIEAGNRFIVGLHPQTGAEMSRFPAGKAEDPFDSTRLRAGLSMVINGQNAEGRGLGQTVENIVKTLDPAMAATMLGNLQSGGFEITTNPETGETTVRTGSALAVTPGERVEQTRAAKEQAPINAGLANLAGLVPETTIAQARAQNINVDIRPQVIEQLQEQKSATQTFIREARALVGQIRGRPEVLTLAGGVASAVNNLRATAVGMLRAAGLPIKVNGEDASIDELLNEDNYSGALQELGVVDAQVRSRLIGLAFSAAAAAGQTGRGVSDRDIERFIKRIGNSSDPTVLTDVLDIVIEDADAQYRGAVENNVGRRPPSLAQAAAQQSSTELNAAMNKTLGQLTPSDINLLKGTEEGRARLREVGGL